MDDKQTVLVVDDEEMVRKLLAAIVQQHGYNVITAENGLEALSRITAGEADIVMMDIKMPGLSGLDVLERLSRDERWIDFCVIMVTAVADLDTATRAMKLGAYDYITKPFDETETVTKLAEAIRKRDSLLEEKRRYKELSRKFSEDASEVRNQFSDLMDSLFREHVLLHELSRLQKDGGKKMKDSLPDELRDPVHSVQDFKKALLKIISRN